MRLDGPEYRVCASGLPVGGGAVALARAALPDARSLGFVCLYVCLYVCLFVCLFGVFVCGGPVRNGRARAGTSPARSEGPLGVLWVLTDGARRPSAGWSRAHSDTQSTRTVHAGTPARAHAHVPHPPWHGGCARTLTQHMLTDAHAHTWHRRPRTHRHTHARSHTRTRTHPHAHARTRRGCEAGATRRRRRRRPYTQ